MKETTPVSTVPPALSAAVPATIARFAPASRAASARRARQVQAALFALIAGCSSGGDGSGDPLPPQRTFSDGGTATLKSFAGADACTRLEEHIETRLEALARDQLERVRWSEERAVFTPAPTPVSAPPPASAPASDSVSHSSTTVRTAGIDEADVVKNDGTRLLTLKSVSDAVVLSRADLGSAGALALGAQARWPAASGRFETAEGIYLLDGDRAVALTRSARALPPSGPMPMPMPAIFCEQPDCLIGMATGQAVDLRVVDLGSATLATTWAVRIDGHLLGSRRVGDRIHLVTRTAVRLPEGAAFAPVWNGQPPTSARAWNAAIDAQILQNARLIPQATLADWLAPVADGATPERATPTADDCAAVSSIDAPTIPGWLQLTTVDVTARTVSRSLVFGEAGWIYQSPHSLILQTLAWDGSFAGQTHLHRFVPEADGRLVYHGSGKVEGRLINDYAIDEPSAGLIRIAKTGLFEAGAGPGAGAGQYSLLQTLRATAAPQPWTELGRSAPIAPGEALQSARFLGDRAYLVTFRQIDPFFVYDLSDPAAPRQLGELKLPGFSTFLQPVGANHVLGIGYGDGGWPRQIKATLFDVTDPTAPREQSSLALGDSYTSSDALWDPHAFTWYSPNPAPAGLPGGGDAGTFAIPVRSYAAPYYGTNATTGVRLISVRPAAGAAALTLNGTIALDDLLTPQGPYQGWRSADARRAVFVDRHAYAIADGAVRSAPILTPAQTAATLMLP